MARVLSPPAPLRTGLPTVGIAGLPAVSAAAMADADRVAAERHGISLLQMLEHAGSWLAEVVRLELDGGLRGRTVAVLAGPGTNGSGGLAAARHLANRGACVQVVLAQPASHMTYAGRHHAATLVTMGIPQCVAALDLDDAGLERQLRGAELVVDALLGSGASGSPRGAVRRIVLATRAVAAPVVSLDVPTGLDPDTGQRAAPTIHARATLALAVPKPGLLAAPPSVVGRLYLADVGIPAAAYAGLEAAIDALFAPGPLLVVDRTA